VDKALAFLQDPSVLSAIGFVAASYFIITLDRQRANSPSKDDTQVGIKLILWGLIIAGIGMAASGVAMLLAFVLGGFKGEFMIVRLALSPIVVGAGVVVVMRLVLMPKTNNATMKQPERYALGMLGLYYGVLAIGAVRRLLEGVFASGSWGDISGSLTALVVYGAIGFLAILMLGAKSGWTGPAPRLPQQGYPPQGGGYPPQGGGYPPQGGGYPPQGGGYPPQGGGYPPQGGGYPPQGGGGYPPPA
jgi:hypothetical protein